LWEIVKTYIRTLAIACVMLGFAVLSHLVPHGRTWGAVIFVLVFALFLRGCGASWSGGAMEKSSRLIQLVAA